MSAITDIAVLIIPIPLVYTLQMSFKKRLRIMAMLGAGGIATGASVVRLVIVLSTNTSAGDETITFTRFNLLAYVFSYPLNPEVMFAILIAGLAL